MATKLATRKKRRGAKGPSKQRASWKGLLTFGLVSFPVEAVNALNREKSDIHFHQIHAPCHGRVHHKNVCPIHGEVPNDEIVSGYEYKKGEYVEVEPSELEALRSERERALRIDAFVNPDEVDPVYFDGRMYYLVPAEAAAKEPYSVLVEALERENRVGVGQVVFSGKDQLALVRPLNGLLHMAMLRYEPEIKPAESFAVALKKPKNVTEQVRLAQTLIEDWSHEHFDFAKYDDTYRERVEELIQSKIHGRAIEPPAEEEPAEVLNLMDALKKSVHALARRKGEHKGRARRRSA